LNNQSVANYITVHVLLATDDEFAKMEEKQKLPKPKLTKQVKQVIEAVLQKRLSRYPTSIKVSLIALYITVTY
jgi:SET domain-containing protein 6